MQRRLFIGNLLKPVGLFAAACAAAPLAAQSTPGAPNTPAPNTQAPLSPEKAAARQAQAALNPLAVSQASFHRLFKNGTVTVESFPEFVTSKCGLTRVQWSAPLLPGITEASAKTLRAACDARQVRSTLLDPAIGPGLASADESARSAAIEKLKPWCAIASALSCTGLAIDLRGEGTYEEQLPRAVAGANLAFKMASEAGLPLVAQCSGGLTSNGTFMAALMEQLKNPAIRLEPTFDSWKVSDKDTYNRSRGLEMLIPYAASVLADYLAFLPTGESTTFKTDYLMSTVRKSTFRGPVTILYKGPADEVESVLKAKKILTKYKCVA
ncbi:MAG: TIM barrel protein [Planctomycetes bacterium]|nr:TIM barrel protein [Planctomycetota bacterium]